MDQFIWDEINKIKALMMPGQKRIASHNVKDEYVIFVGRSEVSRYFACAAMLIAKAADSVKVHTVLCCQDANAFLDGFFAEAGGMDAFGGRVTVTHGAAAFLAAPPAYSYKKVRFCTFLQAEAAGQEYEAELQQILDHARTVPTAKLVHTQIIPELKTLPGSMTSLSEREYEVYAAQFPENSPEQLVVRCEEILRGAAKCGLNTVVTRMQNVFGPGVANRHTDALRSGLLGGTVTTDSGVCNCYIDMNHITFAAAQVHWMFVKGKSGNIYNLAQFVTTPFRLAADTYYLLADHGAKLDCQSSPVREEYHLLCRKKAQPVLSSKYAAGNLVENIYKSIISGTELVYQNRNDRFIYDGKLEEIKRIELDMMAEIKRICDKHGIKYFLVGGSMLGAVRHHGFIPWDDDLDIGMLREDYEKFARVAPGELDEKYSYQSNRSGDGSHYIFDKIRLKDTFFSTKFSDRFAMENGLFIDILVYDRTAKSKAAQDRHIKALCIWSRAINVRWVNVPRKNVAYRLTKLLLPVMRLFPMGFYHKVFDRILTHYDRTDSPWLIDGVGQNIRKGAFPAEWFDEIIEVPFENMTLPIPAKYDEYLRHWYGEKYMQLLPISQRNSGHIMKRIDLGSYVTGFGLPQGEYHKASLAGELYDE